MKPGTLPSTSVRPSSRRYRKQVIAKVLAVITASTGCTHEDIRSASRKDVLLIPRVSLTATIARLFPDYSPTYFFDDVLPGKSRWMLKYYLEQHSAFMSADNLSDDMYYDAIEYRDLIDELQKTFPTPAKAVQMINIHSCRRIRYEVNSKGNLDDPSCKCAMVLMVMYAAVLSEVPIQLIRSASRKTEFVIPRIAISQHLRRLFPKLQLGRIGAFIGKDHTSVMHQIKSHQKIVQEKNRSILKKGTDKYLYINKELKRIFRKQRVVTAAQS